MFSSKGTANGIGNKGTSIAYITSQEVSEVVGSSEHCVGTLSNGTHLTIQSMVTNQSHVCMHYNRNGQK